LTPDSPDAVRMMDPPGTDLVLLAVVLAIAAEAYLIPKKTLPSQRQGKNMPKLHSLPLLVGR
jgi:hypothetical protein